MSYSIDLSDFDLVIDESGNFVVEDDQILIQHRITKEEVNVLFANVAPFYGLYGEGKTSLETPATEPTTIAAIQHPPSRTPSMDSSESSTSLPPSPLTSAPPSPTHVGKKNMIDNNNTSGAAYEEMDFGEEMNEIIQRDDSFLLDTGVSPGLIYSKKGSIPLAQATSKSISTSASTSELASTSGLASTSVLTSTSR
ncbi:uncharacterized protein LOC129950667 [Eupeodes corollae]|uniref:uncharacterized protein LOC129950667 n=1 Tax=Eupeodes corollae TaxID=290404 RepID=UPI00248FC21C|nr:uncharacterized protein LOC129950667 [Eupeodes corollae]